MIMRASWFKNPLSAVFLPVICCLAMALSGVCAAGGSALQFNGTSSRVDVTKALISDDITMSAWVKATTPWVNDDRVVISNSYWGAAASRVGFHLMVRSTGMASSRYQTQADGVGVWSVSGTTVVTGAWHHLTYVKQGTKISIVVDGKEEGVLDNMPASVAGLAIQDFIRIGCNTSNARFLSGLIDEVCIWNYARTVAQIQESMNHELRGTEAGLVGYWQFNEGQGTTAADSAPIPHNGTLVGATWTTDTPPLAPGPAPASAQGASPAGGAVDAPRDVVLSWRPGGYADTHDVYLGSVFADVNAANRTAPKGVLASQAQDANTYDPPALLDFGKTYYWRVDEVNAPPSTTIVKGSVWSFTVEPYTYAISPVKATASSTQGGMTPDKTIDGSGLTGNLHGTDGSTMWLSAGVQPNWIQYQFDKVYKLYDLKVWNSNQTIEAFIGFGAKKVTIEYSADGTTWKTLDNVPEFARASSAAGYAANTTVNLGGVMAQYVKLTINSTWGGLSSVTGLSEVRFSYVPVQARSAQPAPGATGQSVSTTLSWRPGRDAASHKVFFGTDQAAVANGTASAQIVTGHAFDPGALTYGTTYYWRVDEVNAVTYPGDVWSFTTQESVVVDDFESYDDTDNRIYDTWIDGLTNGNSGSTVGYFSAPFAERTIFHGGKQSMPLDYNNTKSPFYSEAERAWDSPQNWAANGADTLTLYFRGNPAAFAETAAGVITMSGGGVDIWNSADQFRFAYKQLSGNGSLIAKVESVDNTDPWAKGGVMIRESLDPGARFAAVYATPGNGVRYQARLLAATAATSDTAVVTTEQTALKAPVWIKVERTGNNFSCFYSTDGAKWTAMSWNPQTIALGANVYIGLAVTSHNAAATTVAQFSNIATTGAVTGAWQAQAIGVAQPTNDAAPLYVAVQDSAGKVKVVMHPDPAATTLASWQQWRIPLSAFSAGGVKLSGVKKLMIGAGDRSNPKAGGAGRIFIDDIGIGHPAVTNP
jgi:regulation of enolase protein 1 (concanavalin A-like superfamily)